MMRKRKGGLVEETEPVMTKSRRLDDDTMPNSTTTNSRTKCPLLLGGISISGREPEDRHSMGAMKGVGFDDDREERRWNGRLGLDGTTNWKHINSQMSV